MSEAPKSTAGPPSAPGAAHPFEAKLKFYDRILATCTALLMIVGVCWGVYKYLDNQRQAIKLRQLEYDLMVFQEKKQTYLALVDAASEIAACKNHHEVRDKAPLFLKLYYGRAHAIVALDPPVSKEKIAFGKRLRTYLDDNSEEPPHKHFGKPALALTMACRDHIDPRQLEESEP